MKLQFVCQRFSHRPHQIHQKDLVVIHSAPRQWCEVRTIVVVHINPFRLGNDEFSSRNQGPKSSCSATPTSPQ